MNNCYTLAPIVLFVYNRPEHTKRTVEGLLRNPESKNSVLYVFADGLKPGSSEEDRKRWLEVRNYIHTINGFLEVIVDETDTNRGLAPSTIRGCSRVFEKYDRLIMMEDDDVPSPYFLDFENRCLEKYKDDENIWCVSGFVDNGLLPEKEGDDLCLVNRPSSWGFGTWKRCWDLVIWDQRILKTLFLQPRLVRGFAKWAGADFPQTMLNLFRGRSSSWSIRYNFAAFLCNSKTIIPNCTLIDNIGCDGTGTHSPIIIYNVKFKERPINIPVELKFDNSRNNLLLKHETPKSLKSLIRHILTIYMPKIVQKIDSTR